MGLRFDSKKEARRFEALLLRLQAGEIQNLKLQQDYTLQEAYTLPTESGYVPYGIARTFVMSKGDGARRMALCS